MGVSEQDFRAALGAWPSGVTVVSCARAGVPVGTTVSAFFSVSLSPPLVGVCLDSQSRTLSAMSGGCTFGISVLSDSQANLSERFAQTGNEHVRFDGLAVEAFGQARVPVPAGAVLHLACSLEQMHDAGDHRLCIGRVLQARRRDGAAPLVYHSARYCRLEPLKKVDR